MDVGDRLGAGANAVDEGAGGRGRGVLSGGDLDGFAGAAVGHLSRGLVGGAGRNGFAV